MGDLAILIEPRKQQSVKDFRLIGTIEAFDESVVIGLAELDVAQFNVHHRAPSGKSLRGQLWDVMQLNRSRGTRATRPVGVPVCVPALRQAGIDLDEQRFAGAFVSDVQGPEAAFPIKDIAHKVHGPDFIGHRRRDQRLIQPHQALLARDPSKIAALVSSGPLSLTIYWRRTLDSELFSSRSVHALHTRR